MDAPRVLENQTVVVRGRTIVAVGPAGATAVPPNARRIDARGKYLIPGLADMHVHFVAPQHHADISSLLIANGVTSVRCMWGTPQVLDFARGAAVDPWVPRIYTTGPPTSGSPPVYSGMRIVMTPAEARRAVADDRAAGYDAVKVYNRVPAPAYRVLVESARAAGLPVIGHVPEEIDLSEALASGQISIEHLQGYVRAIVADDVPAEAPARRSSTALTSSALVDLAKLPAVVAATKAHGVYNTPTLVVYGNLLQGFREGFTAPAEFRYVSPALRAAWEVLLEQWRPLLAGGGLPEYEKGQQLLMQMTRALDEGDALLLLGTDAPNPYVVPGFSVHDELAMLVRSGLSPYRALRTATVNAAAFFGRGATDGGIQTGRSADLVLLAANPLQDIRATRRVNGVMVRGSWLPEAELRSRLDAMAKRFEEQQ
jgi:imidazolonepropionase-like amidohydrolase